MATSPQHAAWIRRGRPWRLALPLLALRNRLRAYGYTVYDIGNSVHLDAQPPEHHCPFSETNWPAYVGVPLPDVVTAIDVMPPPSGRGLPSLQQLGAQLFADKQAGVAAWLVDMNWGPTSNRTAVRDTWRPTHIRSSSSDTGHIHASCRSDFIDSTAGDGYDPIARLRGQNGDDMPLTQAEKDEIVYRTATIVLAGIQPAGYAEFTAPEPYRGQLAQALKFSGRALADQAVALSAGLKAIAEKVDVELAAIEEAARAGAARAYDPVAMVALLAPVLAERLGVDQAAVVAALDSPEGQAALERAANAAEDS